MNIAHVIIKPLITEASMKAVNGGKYSFAVAKKATKEEIKKAITQLFSVTVSGIATSIVKGKKKRVGPRRQEIGQTEWKKAVVKLKKGDTISLFEPGGTDTHEGHNHK